MKMNFFSALALISALFAPAAAKAQTAGDTWNAASSTAISLGNGNVTISRPGTYVLSGNLRNGQVLIDAGSGSAVRIVLNGASIENPSGAAIYAKSGAEITVSLAAGTQNTLTDGKNYVLPAGQDEPKAALFVKNSLIINGSGTLSVTGNYNNGIHAKDLLTVNSGTIRVNAVDDALRGGDGVVINGGTFNVTAGKDGVKSTNTAAGKGYVTLNGGTFTVKAGNDGFQAESVLTVNGGTFNVTAGGGAASAPQVSAIGRGGFGNGDWGARGWGRGGAVPSASAAAETDSMKAFKAGTELAINNGTFTIDAEDDAFHSNGNLSVKAGTFTIQTGDDGFHADNTTRIAGGRINIVTSYEGIEGKVIEISGGDISLVSRDDGINAASGSAASTGPARGGRPGASTSGGVYARISGGTVRVLAGGDGIDANGDLYLAGGELYLSGPSQGMQGAVDLDGSFVVSGGKLITAGSALNPAAQSTQPVILVSYTQARNSGSLITLKDRAGRTLLEYTAQTAFSASAFSSPDFKAGETYSLYLDGKKLTDISVRGTVTALADNGGTYALGGRGGMGGGMGGRGGWR